MRPRVLLLGGSGQVGTALTRLIPDVTAPTRDQYDLRVGADGISRLIEETTPEVVINCAAYTAVDRAESEEAEATAINGEAVGVLAQVTDAFGIPLITFSTDYVFDGSGRTPYVESSPTAPINAYGRSKLWGERLALQSNPRTLVIRTSWVISGTHPNFVASMLRLAREARPIRVVDDQHGCPTVAADLAVATIEAIDREVTGILHLTNQGETTWFELAGAAIVQAGLDPSLVSPCSTEEYPTTALRPSYSILGSERLTGLGITALPSWRGSLPGVVSALSGAGSTSLG